MTQHLYQYEVYCLLHGKSVDEHIALYKANVMRFPADIRIDTPQRVWLAVLAVTAIVLCTSLFVMTIVLWFYGTANIVVAYLIAGLVPVLAAPPVI